MKTIEYRVRPVTRFVVTRFESDGGMASSTSCGEFDREEAALRVGFAAAKMDQEEFRFDHNRAKVIFPDMPENWSYYRET